MWVEVGPVKHEMLLNASETNTEDNFVRSQIIDAREKQMSRHNKLNSELNAQDLITKVVLGEKEKEILNTAARTLGLSPRSYHRIIKVARTIADLEEATEIGDEHILEALQYRPKIDK